MVFQDPAESLNSRMTVGTIIGEPLDIHQVGDPKERRTRGQNPNHASAVMHVHRTNKVTSARRGLTSSPLLLDHRDAAICAGLPRHPQDSLP